MTQEPHRTRNRPDLRGAQHRSSRRADVEPDDHRDDDRSPTGPDVLPTAPRPLGDEAHHQAQRCQRPDRERQADRPVGCEPESLDDVEQFVARPIDRAGGQPGQERPGERDEGADRGSDPATEAHSADPAHRRRPRGEAVEAAEVAETPRHRTGDRVGICVIARQLANSGHPSRPWMPTPTLHPPEHGPRTGRGGRRARHLSSRHEPAPPIVRSWHRPPRRLGRPGREPSRRHGLRPWRQRRGRGDRHQRRDRGHRPSPVRHGRRPVRVGAHRRRGRGAQQQWAGRIGCRRRGRSEPTARR